MNTIGFKIDDYFIWSVNQIQAIERYLMIKRAKCEEPNMELINNIRNVSVQENVVRMGFEPTTPVFGSQYSTS